MAAAGNRATARFVQRLRAFDAPAQVTVYDNQGQATGVTWPAGTVVSLDDTKSSRVNMQTGRYRVKVTSSPTANLVDTLGWVDKASLSPILESADDKFRVEAGVYQGAPDALLAHVFLGIENAAEADENPPSDPPPSTPTGKMTWKGFYPREGLEAEQPEDLDQYEGVEREGEVKADLNKAMSPKSRFSTTEATPEQRSKLVWWIDVNGPLQDYVYGTMGCIGFGRAALAHAGLDPTALGIQADEKFAKGMYGAEDTATFENEALRWTTLKDGNSAARMDVAYDADRELMLTKQTDGDGKGVLRKEHVIQVQRKATQARTRYAFETIGRTPGFFFQVGEVQGNDELRHAYPVVDR